MFGLTGPWGSGKTSLIAMIDEYLDAGKQAWAIARFTPWSASATSSLLAEFYSDDVERLQSGAAAALYHNAGEDSPTFDRTNALRELLRRPYWLNTARFYGGNAKGHAIYSITAGIEDELREGTSSAAFVAAWTLLTDGVFNADPTRHAGCSPPSAPVLALPRCYPPSIAATSGHPPELPDPTDSDEPDPTWARLTQEIRRDPADPGTMEHVRVIREL